MKTIEARINDRTLVTDKCWLWCGSLNGRGYGIIRWNGRNIGVHRAVWIIKHGPVADDLYVMHQCDNPRCVRLSHLMVGTPQDNAIDMARKNRNRRIGNGNKVACKNGHAFNRFMLREGRLRRRCRICDNHMRRIRRAAEAKE